MLLRDNVYESLRSDILTCRLAPGDDMREQDPRRALRREPQPVREALLRLEREHLVTVQPRRKSYRVKGDLAERRARPVALPTRAGAGLRGRRRDRARHRTRR